jgi:acyl-coenzyme A synthetase/AMP-(fatty) acid ligase
MRDKLADYKLPRHIVLMPALPRNATGKILKTELRKQAAK